MRKPLTAWAPIVRNSRGEWIPPSCIRYTRREAREAWLGDIPAEHHKRMLKNVRFARVTVQPATQDREVAP